jgi:excisionase family DNA binding protein
MPFRLPDLEGVADYLHLTVADVEQRVKNREIPFKKRGERIVFRKSEIDAWVSQRSTRATAIGGSRHCYAKKAGP